MMLMKYESSLMLMRNERYLMLMLCEYWLMLMWDECYLMLMIYVDHNVCANDFIVEVYVFVRPIDIDVDVI